MFKPSPRNSKETDEKKKFRRKKRLRDGVEEGQAKEPRKAKKLVQFVWGAKEGKTPEQRVGSASALLGSFSKNKGM